MRRAFFQVIFLAGAFASVNLCVGKTTSATVAMTRLTSDSEARTFDKLTTRALIQGKVAGVEYRPNVKYLSPGRQETLDVFLPAKARNTQRRPAIVMIHGGGWTGGYKEAARELQMGTEFARAGYVAVSVEYLKTRGQLWPTNLMDCKNAVRWVRANADSLQVDPERIGVIGGSAGGHLSLMVAYTSDVAALEPAEPYPGIRDDVQACVDLYGITDLKVKRIRGKYPSQAGKTWGSQLLNQTQQKNPAQWKLGSPIDQVTSSSPPTLIIHGDADVTVDLEQSEALVKKLEAAGVDHQFIVLPRVPHAVLLNDKRVPRDLRPTVTHFFDKHLKGQPADSVTPVAPPELTSGRLGFAALDLATSHIYGYNVDKRFPLQSTFKTVLAVRVLELVDAGKLSLDQDVDVRRQDLSVGGVIYKEFTPPAKRYTVGKLLELAVGMSDNTAADVLMDMAGGPSAVNAVLAQAGISDMQINRYEREFQPELAGLPPFAKGEVVDMDKFNRDLAGQAEHSDTAKRQRAAVDGYINSTDLRDSGTPRAAVQFLAHVAQGDLLTSNSNALLLKIMENTVTGAKRVKVGLPSGAKWAHKTGTGGDVLGLNTGTNDIGILTLPDGREFAVAVFLSGSAEEPAERETICAEVARRLVKAVEE